MLQSVARFVRTLAAVAGLVLAAATPSAAQQDTGTAYSPEELVNAGNQFFGQISAGLATVVEKAVADYGQPNGYILGQEGTGAIFGGLRYGEGTLYTRNAGTHRVFWQGPTLGFDIGADGARTMILVYELPSVASIFRRYAGVDGSAYIVGGFGMTVLRSGNSVLVPVRSGVGARLGINVGYLKFTPEPTWNPF
ncbi:DUF1134 domain-containing protein [Methylobrevis albus]|uniref:DUF1134 domain-containing protein n=1 Tax=Methylobrevis albus TaxID=2793297 RepID=A0A931I5Q9_9HYPH|nr:DUF1134 domain-containing protein [Methylobrevis albus]MBH0239323.1 DUF1134 domain-containing protein [Methylobrevis albus]